VRVARVLPDVAALDREFDYLADDATPLGALVRVDLHGRRVGGWVVGLADRAATDRPLKPIARVRGLGPPAELVALAGWASWRWAGRRAAFLRTASPPRAVRALPPPGPWQGAGPGFAVDVVRVPPAADWYPVVREAVWGRCALVLHPSAAGAASLAARLAADGAPVAALPGGWAAAAAGGRVAVGSRAAAWAPAPGLAAVVVVDEHDAAYAEERAPTWHAREVVLERARRAGAQVVLVSPAPSLEALSLVGAPSVPSRAAERAGWPILDIVDRRREDPRHGLVSERLVALVRSGRRVVCVLNRTGRSRLSVCAACGELARCEACGAAVVERDGALACPRCGTVRPVVCGACGAGRLAAVRPGVARLRDELAAIAGEPVGRIDRTGEERADARVVVGTEAALHRVGRAEAVVFLDFDQELLAPRIRAAERAMALIVRAARLVGGRAGGGRVVVQTRVPHHEVLEAAVRADPGRLAAAELARRRAVGFPPFAALAVISGPRAADFAAALAGRAGLAVMGPADGRWLVRAPDHAGLCDALAATPRPPGGGLRIAVDPQDA
jgi:primosomal protein N' (replication factor Y)